MSISRPVIFWDPDPLSLNLDPFSLNPDPFSPNPYPFSPNPDPFSPNQDPFSPNPDPLVSIRIRLVSNRIRLVPTRIRNFDFYHISTDCSFRGLIEAVSGQGCILYVTWGGGVKSYSRGHALKGSSPVLRCQGTPRWPPGVPPGLWGVVFCISRKLCPVFIINL